MGILAAILGIIAVLVALLATFLFGNAGLIIALVLAAVAIVLAVLKRKKDGKGGIVAIVICALAVILAFVMNSSWSKTFKAIREKALEYKPDSLWAQVSEDTSGGLMGIIKRIPQDDATLNALVQEMTDLNKLAEADEKKE